MASQQTPEQPSKSQSCFTKIVFAVGGLIAIFVVLAIFGSQAKIMVAEPWFPLHHSQQ